MDLLLTRQAVFDRNRNIHAYDLIFEDYKDSVDYEAIENKRIKFICNLGTSGLSNFTDNKKSFCNFTYVSLLEGIPELLGKDNIIVQISSKINNINNIRSDLNDLKESNFEIAYVIKNINDYNEDICSLIDIFKIDFNNLSEYDIRKLSSKIRRDNPMCELFANNIDNEEKYNLAEELNFNYFSGKFYSNPVAFLDKDIAVKNSNRFDIVIELLKEDLDIERLEYIIKTDLSISYKLIRFLNSPVFGFVQNINSIRQAIMLLGEKGLRRWLTLVVVSEMYNTRNEEMMNNTIIRGRFCELVAEKIGILKGEKAFMVGLFSELNVLFEKYMKDILKNLHLEKEVSDALLGKENILKSILELVKAYEKMDVKSVKFYSKDLEIDEMILFELYSQSIDWLNDTKVNINKNNIKE